MNIHKTIDECCEEIFHRNEPLANVKSRLKLEVEQYANEKEETQLKRLYDWLMDENRELAQTFFTAGILRNVAKEIEYRIKK